MGDGLLCGHRPIESATCWIASSHTESWREGSSFRVSIDTLVGGSGGNTLSAVYQIIILVASLEICLLIIDRATVYTDASKVSGSITIVKCGYPIVREVLVNGARGACCFLGGWIIHSWPEGVATKDDVRVS